MPSIAYLQITNASPPMEETAANQQIRNADVHACSTCIEVPLACASMMVKPEVCDVGTVSAIATIQSSSDREGLTVVEDRTVL